MQSTYAMRRELEAEADAAWTSVSEVAPDAITRGPRHTKDARRRLQKKDEQRGAAA